MYGVCKICGCTDNDPCIHPDWGCCWWVDDSHELCSHCADPEIYNDPGALKKARIGMTAERGEFEMEEPDDGNASPSVHSGGVLAAADLMERLVEDIAAGADMETVVDKYVKCETPELRQQLIDGLRRLVGDRMISQSLREGRCEP